MQFRGLHHSGSCGWLPPAALGSRRGHICCCQRHVSAADAAGHGALRRRRGAGAGRPERAQRAAAPGRRGALVLFPQLYQAPTAKAAAKWAGKLLRRLPSEGDAAVEAEGLLMYTGAYIRQNLLDKKRMIHAALLVKDVLLVTNHVDISTMRGHASSMTGEPVRAATAAPSPADAGSKPS